MAATIVGQRRTFSDATTVLNQRQTRQSDVEFDFHSGLHSTSILFREGPFVDLAAGLAVKRRQSGALVGDDATENGSDLALIAVRRRRTSLQFTPPRSFR
jgi:hypothetical protein